MSDVVVTKPRIARKLHVCTCGHGIRQGDAYLEHVAFPGHIAVGGDRPERLRECAKCAIRYGREILLPDIPYEQLCRDGLL